MVQMGYDEVHSAAEEQRVLAEASRDPKEKATFWTAYFSLLNRLDRMTPPQSGGPDDTGGTPAAQRTGIPNSVWRDMERKAA